MRITQLILRVTRFIRGKKTALKIQEVNGTPYALFIRKGGLADIWYVRFTLDGRVIRRSCHSRILAAAHDAARLWILQYQRRGAPPRPEPKESPCC
jgi:hypothetical protein